MTSHRSSAVPGGRGRGGVGGAAGLRRPRSGGRRDAAGRGLPGLGARRLPRRLARDLHERRRRASARPLRRQGDPGRRRLPPPGRRARARRLQRRPPGRPEDALRPDDQRHAGRDRLHLEHLRRREHRRDGDGPGRRRRATSSSTSCTSPARSISTRSSRSRASSCASSSTATGPSTRPTWTRPSTATPGWCRWRWSPTSTASCTTARRCADLAHARGAYVFADIIQAVGAVPVDVKALGIDFAATGTYKWIMGERGFGFLYVSEDLQGAVLPTTRYGHRQVTNFNRAELTWEPLPGAARYETGGIAVLLAAAVSEGIDYVNAPRPGQDPRPRHPAHRSAARRAAAARLPGADPAHQPDADPRLRAQGRRRHQQGAARRQDRGDGHRQREAAAAVGLGVQHPRRHRPRRRGPRRTPEQHRPRLTQWQL